MKLIAVAVMLGIAASGLLAVTGPLVSRYFQQQYAIAAYRPEQLVVPEDAAIAEELTLEGLRWISHEKWYCHTTALQMAAQSLDMEASVHELNFVTGFTYGAFCSADQSSFISYNDPLAGAQAGCQHLGMRPHYIVTDDPWEYLDGIKRALCQGSAVILQLNAAKLWNEKGFFPHSEVLVGYDTSGFFYLETALEDRDLPEAEGIRISNRHLLDAVRELNEIFARPWTYAFITLEACTPIGGPEEVLKRNGENTIGQVYGPTATGAPAIRRYAKLVLEEGCITNAWALETLSYTRTDNAAYLEQRFPEDEDVLKAAALLREAGLCYQEVATLACPKIDLDQKTCDEVFDLFNKGASLEERAGEILLQLSASGS